MSNLSFDDAFSRLIGNEGGYTDDPNDPGNWTGGRPNVGELKGTKFGIAANTYPDLDIKNLTLEQAKAIYKRDWWDKLNADSLPAALVMQLWDFAINAGIARSVMALQRALDVMDDGRLGPATLSAFTANHLSDVIMRFNAERIRFYTKSVRWATYGAGWMNRVATNLDYAAKDIQS